MAIGTFALSFMQGLKGVADNDIKCRITSEFAGHSHSWRVYSSDIVDTGVKAELTKHLIIGGCLKRISSSASVIRKLYA